MFCLLIWKSASIMYSDIKIKAEIKKIKIFERQQIKEKTKKFAKQKNPWNSRKKGTTHKGKPFTVKTCPYSKLLLLRG